MKTHVIHWKCRISQKTGIGRIFLEGETGHRLRKNYMKHTLTLSMNPRFPKRKQVSRDTAAPSQRWKEQPLADLSSTVACPICGHPVDDKRMQPHMLRFHSAQAGRADQEGAI